MNNPTKILIDGPAWIGDMVMAQTLFKVLKKHYPKVSIDVLAPKWSKSLLARMPEVAQSIELPFTHGELKLRQRYIFAKTLRTKEYDWAIVLRNSFKSGLIPYWAQIPKRTGWLGEMRYGILNDWRKLDKIRYPLMIERFMALAFEEGAKLSASYPTPTLKISDVQVQVALQKYHLFPFKQPVLAICPGAEYGPAKRWPAEYFAGVANAKIKSGWQVWLFGSEKDASITKKINTLCDRKCVDLAGKTSLSEAIDLLSVTHVVLTNDSGLMHIAAALNRIIIALYGSSSSAFTPPLAKEVHKPSLKLTCSPCFKRECPLGHLKCLNDLRPTEILRVIAKVESQIKDVVK